MSDCVISTGNKKDSSQTASVRQCGTGQDKQETRGEFCPGDDISETVGGILTVRHKQEREGLPLPRITSQGASEMLFHKTARVGPLFPPSIVSLSTGPAAHPHPTRLRPLYEQQQQQTKQTGATSISEEAVVFAVSWCQC